jgi:hypothetical protein
MLRPPRQPVDHVQGAKEIRHLTLILAVTGCLAAFGLYGCGSSGSSSSSAGGSSVAASSSATTHFAKTKFLLHAGLAFGAFHHFIYDPFKAGDLRHPFLHKLTLIKAGLAALFVYHELKLAAVDVHSSKILSALFRPLTAAADKIKSLRSSIVSGGSGPSGVTGLNSQLTQIGSTASSKGQTIGETVPSASQLASGG